VAAAKDLPGGNHHRCTLLQHGRVDTVRALVVPAMPDHLAPINDIYNHYVRTSHCTFDLDPTAMEARRRWFDEHADPRHRIFVATVDGGVVGFASSGRHRPRRAYETSVETSVYLAPAWVGRGIGASLYSALLDALEGEDVHRALAGITQPNEASIALHRRFGFYRVARFSEQGRKFGRYWDVDWYERPIGPTTSRRDT
jgi:phosphinothricin acetyltransferase